MTQSDNAFVAGFFLYHILPYFFAGFILFGLAHYFFHKLGMDNNIDIGKEFETREEFLQRKGIMDVNNSSCPTDQESYDEFDNSIELATK